jgi:dienelactone hydrolase
MLAQRGYVVMSFDNRGTKAPRGRAWRKSIYQKIGIIPPQDQAAAVKAVLKQRPYLDASRVGIWGWSGGGSSSLHAIFKYPKLYSTAIAVAPVPNQRYYDTIYQERYMGLPETNVEGFREGSPINFAKQLEGNRQLSLSGHRNADRRADRSQQTVCHDGLPQPHALDQRAEEHHSASARNDDALFAGKPAGR